MIKQKPFVFRFFSVLMAFVFGFYIFFSFVFTPFHVYAVGQEFDFPSEWINSSVNADQYRNYFNSLKNNPDFISSYPDEYVVMFTGVSSDLIYAFILEPNTFFSDSSEFDFYTGKFSYNRVAPSLLDSYSFTTQSELLPNNNPTANYNCCGLDTFDGVSSWFFGGSYYVNGDLRVPVSVYPVAVFSGTNNIPFNPDYSLTGVVVGFDFSVEAFTQWLIDTGKYQELPAYIGTAKLKSFVQFYHDWGSSNSIFVIRLVEWFMHFNIASQTIENRNIIKSTLDRLYQEFCDSAFVEIYHNSSILPHHRQNIQTNTTDDDLTLVTDDPNDDTLISILRDILRGVISIPNSIYDNTQAIIAKLDQINHNIIISNNGGASFSTDLSPVLNKMDDIIDKLEADTVSVEIDQTTKDDTDEFFDDWNLEFSTALNNKFPVASQLRTFFTGFFERCGIDADSDGEVYQYYNPVVLTASSVSRSVGSASEADIVSDFLGKFDNSDPTFLDDASFQGVPDLSVSVGGHSVSIIDFRVFAKYRDKIHFIISFVIWTLYLLHLYKALPSIIGQVADVAVKTSDL